MKESGYKIFLLGDLYSTHFIRWINGLISRGIQVHVFTFRNRNINADCPGAKIYYGGSEYEFLYIKGEGAFKKIMLLKYVYPIFRLIRKIKPDIVHAHYASGYGMLGALLFYHPFILSVWGSDIFSFPNKSLVHRNLIRFVLSKADVILATSKTLADETAKYTVKNISVVPFGIDIMKFRKSDNSKKYDKQVTIGTIKSLKKVYGIDILIKTFAELKSRNKFVKLKLLIGGEGYLKDELLKLADNLGIEEDVEFTGKIPYNRLEETHNSINIFANLSLAESFGVSVLEASSCEVPVIASDIGGLKEVVKNNITGYLVNITNSEEVINAFQILIDSPELRNKMGKAGRELVKENYNWENNLTQMINIYDMTYENRRSNTRFKRN